MRLCETLVAVMPDANDQLVACLEWAMLLTSVKLLAILVHILGRANVRRHVWEHCADTHVALEPLLEDDVG